MEVSVENTSTLGRRLKISVPDTAVNSKINERMSKLAKEAHMKGFRPGKVPMSVIQKQFGSSIRQEVLQEVVRESLDEVTKSNQLQPAGEYKIEKLENNGDQLEFVASFEVYPEITLQPFTDVEIERKKVEITEADIDDTIKKLQDQLAHWHSVDREVKKGDKLQVNFARLVDDASKKEEQPNVQLVVGDKSVLPGLSEPLLKKHKHDDVEVDLTYPEDWAEEGVAGKKVKLFIKILDIFEKHSLTPEEFAKKIGVDPEDEAALKEKVKGRMQAELDRILNDEVKEVVLEKLLEINPVDIPNTLLEQEKAAIFQEMEKGYVHPDLQDTEVDFQAKKRVELGLILNEVIKKYKLKASQQKVQEEVQRIAIRFPKPVEVMELYFKNQHLLHSVERVVLLDEAVKTLLTECKINEKEASYDEVMNSQ